MSPGAVLCIHCYNHACIVRFSWVPRLGHQRGNASIEVIWGSHSGYDLELLLPVSALSQTRHGLGTLSNMSTVSVHFLIRPSSPEPCHCTDLQARALIRSVCHSTVHLKMSLAGKGAVMPMSHLHMFILTHISSSSGVQWLPCPCRFRDQHKLPPHHMKSILHQDFHIWQADECRTASKLYDGSLLLMKTRQRLSQARSVHFSCCWCSTFVVRSDWLLLM